MITMHLKFEDDEIMSQPIEILAWSWGFSGDGNGAHDLSLTKFIGAESARCLELAFKADKISRAIFTNEGDTQRITITLKDVLVTHQSIGGSGGETRLTENITLAFAEADFKTEDLLDGRVRAHNAIIKGRV